MVSAEQELDEFIANTVGYEFYSRVVGHYTT